MIKKDDLQEKIQKLKEKEEHKKKKFLKENEEIKALKKENEELKNQLLRSAADLQNLRRRAEEEKTAIIDFAKMQVFNDFLPAIDNFERSFGHLPEKLAGEEWVKGVKNILFQCEDVLKKYGVQEIPVKPGDKFDPTLHEVMMRGEGNPGEVLEVLQKGYGLNGRVIRTAKIKAA